MCVTKDQNHLDDAVHIEQCFSNRAPQNIVRGSDGNNQLKGIDSFLRSYEILSHSRNSQHLMEPEGS